MTAARLLAAMLLVAATGAVARAMRHIDVPHSRLSAMPYDVENWNGRDAEPLDTETVRILAADEYLNRNYSDSVSAPVNLYVAYYGQQRPGVSIHSPLHCLPGTGWEPQDVATVNLQPGDEASGRVRRLIVRKNRDRSVVLYWYAIHGRTLANELVSKAWLLHDALLLRRSDAALVRIVVPIAESDAAAEQHGLAFARAVLPYLAHLWS
jgi:EpsI family protein